MAIHGSFLQPSGFQPSAPVVDSLGYCPQFLQGELPGGHLLRATAGSFPGSALVEGAASGTVLLGGGQAACTRLPPCDLPLQCWPVLQSHESFMPAPPHCFLGAMVGMKWLRSEAFGYCSLEDTYKCRASRGVACHFGSSKLFPPGAVGA